MKTLLRKWVAGLVRSGRKQLTTEGLSPGYALEQAVGIAPDKMAGGVVERNPKGMGDFRSWA